jgi:hypothetical protein
MTCQGNVGDAVVRLRDHGPDVAASRYEAVLAADEPVRGWGSSPWDALRDLVAWHPDEFEAALAEGHREIDAFVLLGDWRVEPENELIGLTCMVLREPDRVPIGHERQTISMPEDAVEVREVARWLLERWRDARGLGS